jgi:hypothetical protein
MYYYHKHFYAVSLTIVVVITSMLVTRGQVISRDLPKHLSETQRDAGLETAMINTLDEEIKKDIISDSENQTRYYYNHVDLNGDNKPETIAYLISPKVCGTGGCLLFVFTEHNGKYELVSEIAPIRPPIIVSDYKTNGWEDLYGFVVGGGITKGYFSQLKFDGKSYPESPFVPSSDKIRQPLTGAAYIADDLLKFRGIRLIPSKDATSQSESSISSNLVKQVQFERGKTGTIISGLLKPDAKHIYKLKARKGQFMSVRLQIVDGKDTDDINITLYVQSHEYVPGRNTTLMEGIDPHSGSHEWSGELPLTDEYEIVVTSPDVFGHKIVRAIRYKVEVAIK